MGSVPISPHVWTITKDSGVTRMSEEEMDNVRATLETDMLTRRLLFRSDGPQGR